jgi:hypothetical protein
MFEILMSCGLELSAKYFGTTPILTVAELREVKR